MAGAFFCLRVWGPPHLPLSVGLLRQPLLPLQLLQLQLPLSPQLLMMTTMMICRCRPLGQLQQVGQAHFGSLWGTLPWRGCLQLFVLSSVKVVVGGRGLVCGLETDPLDPRCYVQHPSLPWARMARPTALVSFMHPLCPFPSPQASGRGGVFPSTFFGVFLNHVSGSPRAAFPWRHLAHVPLIRLTMAFVRGLSFSFGV